MRKQILGLLTVLLCTIFGALNVYAVDNLYITGGFGDSSSPHFWKPGPGALQFTKLADGSFVFEESIPTEVKISSSVGSSDSDWDTFNDNAKQASCTNLNTEYSLSENNENTTLPSNTVKLYVNSDFTKIFASDGSATPSWLNNDPVTPDPEPDPTPDGKLYLRGTINNWDKASIELTAVNNVYTYTLSSTSDIEFKVSTTTGNDINWDDFNSGVIGLSNDTETINPNQSYSLIAGRTGNIKIASGTYTLKITKSGDSYTLCCETGSVTPDPDPTPAGRVFFRNSIGWDRPAVWAWSNSVSNCTNNTSGWPGDPMTWDSTSSLWYWDVPAGKATPDWIIFNNGGNGTATEQTDDLGYESGKIYDKTGSGGGNNNDLDRTGAGLSGTLPVLYINFYAADGETFNDEIINKDLQDKNYRSGVYWLDMNGCTWMGENAVNIGSAESPLPLEVKARGNYTRTAFSKKPFKLKLGKKQDMLGLTPAKSKHYALLAHADDNCGYLRNFVGFNLGRRIGLSWAPGQQPVEVVINGNYRGLYFLTESIRLGDGRVDIQELPDNTEEQALISGGYIVELDNYPEDESAQISMDEKTCVGDHWIDKLRITFNTPEVYSTDMRRFVTEQFSTMNNYVGSNNNDLWKYLDLDDAVRYYLVMEITSHIESYHGSTYLYRDRGEGQKWHFSPLWDMGNAFNGTTYQFFYDCDPFGNTWIPSLRQNAKFNAKLTETWKWFMTNCYDGLMADINEYVEHIRAAAIADYNRWKDAPLPNEYYDYRNQKTNPTPVVNNSDMTARKNSVVNHLNAKINWLKGQWGNFSQGGPYTEPTRDTTEAAPLPDYAKPAPVSGFSGTLPVVVINTTNGAAVGYGDAGMVNGSIYIDPLETGKAGLVASAAVTAEAPMVTEIKGRSLNSWNTYAKKPYKLKLDSKCTVFGMDKSKHFVLMPYVEDQARGLLSNYMGHKISEALGLDWTGKMEPVEVVLNGEYLGVYFFGENIRGDRMGVIDKGDKGHDAEQHWVLEVSSSAPADEVVATLTQGSEEYNVVPTLPEFIKMTEAEVPTYTANLRAALTQIETALTNAAANGSDWKDVIDIDQAAKFYVVQELMDCSDAFTESLFFYHTVGGKWMVGPVWNFANSFDARGSKNSLIHSESHAGAFISALYKNNEFRRAVISNFLSLVTPASTSQEGMRREGGVPAIETIKADVVALSAAMQTALVADKDKWSEQGYDATGADVATLNAAVDQHIDFLAAKTTEGGAGWNEETLTGISDITVDASGVDTTPVYTDMLGRRVAHPTPGSIYIVRRANTITKELVK